MENEQFHHDLEKYAPCLTNDHSNSFVSNNVMDDSKHIISNFELM